MKDYKVRTYNSAQCGGTHLSFEYSGERGKISEAVYRAQSDFQGSRVTQRNPVSKTQKIIYYSVVPSGNFRVHIHWLIQASYMSMKMRLP